jgi:hypothetical protein
MFLGEPGGASHQHFSMVKQLVWKGFVPCSLPLYHSLLDTLLSYLSDSVHWSFILTSLQV